MQITTQINPVAKAPTPALLERAERTSTEEFLPEDQAKLSRSTEPSRSEVYGRAYGTSAAATGALIGRFTVLPGAGALGLGALGSRVGGLPGAVLGGAVGAVLGLGLEFGTEITKVPQIGHITGGLVGGLAGYAAGRAVGAVTDPGLSDQLRNDSQTFSLGALPKRLADPTYTNQPKLGDQVYQEIMNVIEPGDVVVTSQNSDFRTEFLQYVLEGKGNWVHGMLYSGEGLVYDSNSFLGGQTERPLRQALATSERVAVLRPKYESEGQADRVLAYAKSQVGNPYKMTKHLEEGPTYCTGAVYNALRAEAPEIEIGSSTRFGRTLVTGDSLVESPSMEVLYTNGSSLKSNYRSKFT